MSCALTGCNKRTSGTHVACGEHHHFLLMDSRYSSCRSKQSLISQIHPHLCAFSPCKQPPSHGHMSCCSKQHSLSWLTLSYASLRPDQICRLPDCSRHVFVELHRDGSLEVYDFCGWTHCQQFYIRHALRSIETRRIGLEPSFDSRMEALRDYAQDQSNRPSIIEVDEDFFNKHPWEVITQPDMESCWLIVRRKWRAKGKSQKTQRKWGTKDNYHWRQSSGPNGNCRPNSRYSKTISVRYLVYEKEKTWTNENVDVMEAFTLREYTWKGLPASYSLVELTRGVKIQARKRQRLSTDDQGSNIKKAIAEDGNHDEAVCSSRVEDVCRNDGQLSIGNPAVDGVVNSHGHYKSNNMQAGVRDRAEDVRNRNDDQFSIGNSAGDAIDNNHDRDKSNSKQDSAGNLAEDVVEYPAEDAVGNSHDHYKNNSKQVSVGYLADNAGNRNHDEPVNNSWDEDAVDNAVEHAVENNHDQPESSLQSNPVDGNIYDALSPLGEVNLDGFG